MTQAKVDKMQFEIYTMSDNGSGMVYQTKEEFLHELSLMIDDCISNGGRYFTAHIDAGASCFYNNTDEEENSNE